jgi:Flp pilus assembly pilin Flp
MGASLPEYALLLVLIAVICLAAMSALGSRISNVMMALASTFYLVGRQTLSGVLAIARVGARRSWMESRACGRDSSRLIFFSARVVPGQVQKGSQVNIEDDFSRRP